MTANPPLTPMKVVLYESAGSNELPHDFRIAFMAELLNDGIAVHCLKDSSEVEVDTKAPLCVVGDFDSSPLNENIEFISVNGRAATEVVEEVKQRADQVNEKRKAWKPWFPVIDYDRCTNCMQCLTFCLFDVYSVKDSMITVTNEDKCKTDFPACSRVCPEVAILFPKYKAGPINGDVVRESDVNREAMKVDISALLGGDIYEQLRNRSDTAKQRFARERDDKRALSERMRCLNKLAGQMDIPMEVLKSLPSQDQIRQKAEAAKRRAAEARGDNGRS